MGRKYKYPEVQGWWVYSIYVPSIAKYYIGVSGCKKCSRRWCKAFYKGTALEPYLDEWDSMIKTVIQDGFLTKEESLKKEDALIQELNKLCINERRSGLVYTNDKNAYCREWVKNNTEYQEYHKQYSKQWRLDNPEYHKQYMRQHRLKKKQQNQLTLFDEAS